MLLLPLVYLRWLRFAFTFLGTLVTLIDNGLGLDRGLFHRVIDT